MIELEGVTKIYGSGPVKVPALGPVDLLIEEGTSSRSWVRPGRARAR
jgi:hypothetical protein